MDFSPAFCAALDFTLTWEGGSTLTRDPGDPGGMTRFGISKRYHPDVDVEHLTLDDARVIYHQDYWLAITGDKLPAPLALLTFDAGVNLGTRDAVQLMQRALGVKRDGIIGPKTLNAARSSGDADLVHFTAARAERYATDEDFMRYGYGWLCRTADALRAALAMEIAS